jgi:hypothetical protein
LFGQTKVVTVQSLTVTVKLQLLVLPAPSVATQLTVVVPAWKVEPEEGWQTTWADPQVSVAVALNWTTAEVFPAS